MSNKNGSLSFTDGMILKFLKELCKNNDTHQLLHVTSSFEFKTNITTLETLSLPD